MANSTPLVLLRVDTMPVPITGAGASLVRRALALADFGSRDSLGSYGETDLRHEGDGGGWQQSALCCLSNPLVRFLIAAVRSCPGLPRERCLRKWEGRERRPL